VRNESTGSTALNLTGALRHWKTLISHPVPSFRIAIRRLSDFEDKAFE
jgi:hypothetical protein